LISSHMSTTISEIQQYSVWWQYILSGDNISSGDNIFPKTILSLAIMPLTHNITQINIVFSIVSQIYWDADNNVSSISRGASPYVRWSPPVFGKRHLHSHLDFPQEACSTAWPAYNMFCHRNHNTITNKDDCRNDVQFDCIVVLIEKRLIGESWVEAKYRCKIGFLSSST